MKYPSRLPFRYIASGLFVCLGLLFAHTPAQARRDVSLNAPVAPFRVTDRDAEAGFEFNYLSERQSGGGESIEMSSRAFEEYVRYRAKGYAYHPRFLEFDARVKMGLLQQSVENSGLNGDTFDGGDSSAFLSGYDLFLSFLKEHPVSGTIFARRDRDAVLELFTDRLMIETQEMGGTLHLKRGPLPMDLSVSRANIREWGFDSQSESTVQSLDYAIRHAAGKWMNSELRYRFQDYQQDFSADTGLFNVERNTQIQTHDLNFLNTIYLDDSRRSYLSSNLRWLEQSGTQDLTSLYGQERLHLQHTDNLRSYILGSFLENQLSETTVRTLRGEAGVDHKLFDSLESHLDVHWRQSDFDGGTERQYGPTGRLAYRKRTPWGTLGLGFARTMDRVERQGGEGVRPVVDESVTLRSGINNFLGTTGAIVASIVVTNAAGNVIYDEGFDYEIVTIGDRVALRILPGGRMTDGEAVLVDYDVAFTTDIAFTQHDQDLYANYDFDKILRGLSLYARWHDLSVSGAPEDDLSILEFTDRVAGFAWRWRWLTWREEYEVYDSPFSTYQQLLSQLEGSHNLLGSRVRLGWHAGFLTINYSDGNLPSDQDHTRAMMAGVALRGPIRTNGYWEVEAQARRETGQIEETLFGVLGKLGMRWRKSKVEAGVRLEQRERFDDSRDRLGVFMQFSREF